MQLCDSRTPKRQTFGRSPDAHATNLGTGTTTGSNANFGIGPQASSPPLSSTIPGQSELGSTARPQATAQASVSPQASSPPIPTTSAPTTGASSIAQPSAPVPPANPNPHLANAPFTKGLTAEQMRLLNASTFEPSHPAFEGAVLAIRGGATETPDIARKAIDWLSKKKYQSNEERSWTYPRSPWLCTN